MKTLKLLACAVLSLGSFAFGQTQSTAKDVTNTYLDNMDTAAEVTAARAKLFVGDSYSGVNRLPLTVSKAYKEGHLADQRPPLTVFLWGDSLMTYPARIAGRELFPNLAFMGWKLMSVDRAVVSAGTGPITTDGAWFNPSYIAVGSSSSVEWVPPTGVTSGVTANRVGVLYYKGASSTETFTLEASTNNGSSWTAISSSNRGSGVTNGTTSITFSASGLDVPPAVGSIVTGTNIPASTYVLASTNTTATLSQAATGSGSGITFTFGSTIDASKTSDGAAWAEFCLANTGPATRVRVSTASGKTAKIIGCGAWFGDAENFTGLGGFVLCDAAQGNTGPEPAAAIANATPTKLSAPLAAMQVNMMVSSWYDLVGNWDTGDSFDDIKTAVEGGITPDWVFITPNPMGTDTSTLDSGFTAGQYAEKIRDKEIAWAIRQNQNVIDLHTRWGGSWTTSVALGMTGNPGDVVHPTQAGQVYKKMLFGQLMSDQLSLQEDAICIGRGPNGYGVYFSADQYAWRIRSDRSAPNSTLIGEITGQLYVTDALNITGASTLSSASLSSTLGVGGTTTLSGALVATPQALSGAGAINVTSATTAYTSTGGSQALTLANGTNGQIKTIVHVVDGGSGILTPTTKTGYTTITFTNAGESVTLQYLTSVGWVIVAINGAVAA